MKRALFKRLFIIVCNYSSLHILKASLSGKMESQDSKPIKTLPGFPAVPTNLLAKILKAVSELEETGNNWAAKCRGNEQIGHTLLWFHSVTVTLHWLCQNEANVSGDCLLAQTTVATFSANSLSQVSK